MTPTLIPAKLESLSLFYTLPNPAANLFPYVTSLLLLCVTLYSWSKPTVQINKQFPLANKTPWFDFGGTRARNDFYLNGQKILMHAVERHGKKPFRLFTDIEDTTVLPPHYADELRNDDRLSPDGPRRRVSATGVERTSFTSTDQNFRLTFLIYEVSKSLVEKWKLIWLSTSLKKI